MSTRVLFLLTALTALLPTAFARAQTAPPGLQRLEFTVDGITREALVHRPAGTNPAPVVFVFHGHGGNMQQAARSFALERHWPEATVVYPQGLNTPGQLTDPEGKRPGWQAGPGQQGDRDLKFFDAMLTRLKSGYAVDEHRIHATGHSNGGGFTYLLWAERGDVFAAMAPSSAVARYVNRLKPKPALHLAGRTDALVKFSWQQTMLAALRKQNGCAETGNPWAGVCTEYPASAGTPLVTFIHPGGHQFPTDGPALIVKFFKEHPGAPRPR